jgi:hypothetical protein
VDNTVVCPYCSKVVSTTEFSEHVKGFDFGYRIDYTRGVLWVRASDGEWHSRILPPRALKHAHGKRGDEIEPVPELK